LGLEEKEIAFQNENLIISQSNPAKCLRCHANASPLWATYFLWPGAYGSNDDQLQMSFDRASWSENTRDFMQTSDRPQSQGRLMGFKSGMADTELEGMINYLKAKPSHARYQWLPSQIAEEGLLRYAGGEAFAKLDLSDKFLAERQRVKADPSWPSRPNLFFQKALMRLNQDRLMAQLEKAGLKNAFKSPAWNVLSQSLSHLKSDEPLRELATFLQRAISQFEFKGPKPEIAEIEALLKENLKDEISMQRTKLNLHQSGVGAGSLEFFNPHYKCSRNVFCWLRDPLKFYSKLLDLKQVSELDKMAFNTETEDPVAMTLLAILLKDRGIDLHHYNMNFRQVSLSFYEGGLLEVGKYLGIEDFLE
ncbi:MAG: hypothetical protein ACXWRA_02975, partial [Pseudobdellovibrionaceae bacterium]